MEMPIRKSLAEVATEALGVNETPRGCVKSALTCRLRGN